MQALLKGAATVVLFASLFSSSFADIYVWTDENGKKHFSDRKPTENVEVQEIAVRRSPSASAAADDGARDRTGAIGVQCNRSLRACESQYRAGYSNRLSLCEGDWSAAAGIGNVLYGGNRTGNDLLRACRSEARSALDERLESCSKTFRACLKGDQ